MLFITKKKICKHTILYEKTDSNEAICLLKINPFLKIYEINPMREHTHT